MRTMERAAPMAMNAQSKSNRSSGSRGGRIVSSSKTAPNGSL